MTVTMQSWKLTVQNRKDMDRLELYTHDSNHAELESNHAEWERFGLIELYTHDSNHAESERGGLIGSLYT